MSTPLQTITRSQSRGQLGLSGADPEPRDDLEDLGSDEDDTGDRPHVNEGNTGNQKLAGEKTTEKPLPTRENIDRKLKELITKDRKGLKNMYGEKEELNKNLVEPIKRGEEMAKRLITEMGCTREIAIELTVLTLYDLAILIGMFWCWSGIPWSLFCLLFCGRIDDSDSMISEENGQRKETLIQFVDHITEIYSMANPSGLLAMRFMNSRVGKKNWTGKSQEYLDHHSYGGVTRIGTELKKKILDRFVIGKPQSKPLLVLIVTDGAVCLSSNISKAI